MFGCAPNKVWALIKDGKVHRLTFSKSLAQHIQRSSPEPFEIQRVTFRTGKRLQHGEDSRSGLYAIMSTRKPDLALRITLFKDAAQLMTPDHWREIRECWIS